MKKKGKTYKKIKRKSFERKFISPTSFVYSLPLMFFLTIVEILKDSY